MSQGFTLIETLIAILILAMTIGALLTLTAGGFFNIRYAKNDIVASNLLQESLEYIRNTRDNASQAGDTWDVWQGQFTPCFDEDNGCIVNPYADPNGGEKVVACSGECGKLYYFPSDGFYGYDATDIFNTTGDDGFETSFVRTIFMKDIPPEAPNTDAQLMVTATMEWKNGTNTKKTTQSIILTKWNLQ